MRMPNTIPTPLRYGGIAIPAVRDLWPAAHDQPTLATWSEQAEATGTVLVLEDGSAYVVTDYWLENGEIRLLKPDGTSRLLPIGRVDLRTTVELNRQRGVRFVLSSAPSAQ
ncbi:MAG: hypothetical protein ACE14L_02780 [Terriglobales bacterium]